MFGLHDFGRACRQFLRHLAESLPAGALLASGIMFGLNQDPPILAGIVPFWLLSAAITVLQYGAVLQAKRFGHTALAIAVVSTLRYTQNEAPSVAGFGDVTPWLRDFIMTTSVVAAIVAVASPLPRRDRPEANSEVSSLGRTYSQARDTPPYHRVPLSDVGSGAFKNMGPSSVGQSCSSVTSEDLLHHIGRPKYALVKDVDNLVATIRPPLASHGDDDSNQAQPDVQ